jgi:HTH-type transcriptional regulator / antitoxin HigA
METLQYKIIKAETQYWDYCNRLEELVMQESNDPEVEEEIDLLTLLIEKWDEEHDSLGKSDPVEVLKFLMSEHNLKSKDLANLLGLSKGFISEILSYKKGFSKENIWKLAEHFKVKQELFNRPDKLISPANSHRKNASVMNTLKQLRAAH